MKEIASFVLSRCCEVMDTRVLLLVLFIGYHVSATKERSEMNLGGGLTVVTTYKPSDCQFTAQNNDVVHYHYVGRLAENNQVFGRSFDYNSPYIVALGQGRIIAGMDRGLVGTCLWERRRISISPHLGYGERGVGNVIPPNATLVFYIRLIKIERDGNVLGALLNLNDMWQKGLTFYSDGSHYEAIDYFEKSIDLFNQYQKSTFSCLNHCRKTDFNKKQDTFVTGNVDLKQLFHYFVQARCVKKCKSENMPNMSVPDSSVLELFKKRVPYSYLQYSYYKVQKMDEAIKCALSFFFYHPKNAMIKDAIRYYREHLKLSSDDFPSREPGLLPHHQQYLFGKEGYNEEKWLKSADHIEAGIMQYKETLYECLLLCDDGVFVNMTSEGASEVTIEKQQYLKLLPDSLDYYALSRKLIATYLQCHIDCHRWISTVNGEYFDKYLANHFHFLQFDYYKLNLLHKAAEAASTYQALEPSDSVMAKNIKVFRSDMNVSPEKFEPRQDILTINGQLKTKKRLLHFATMGDLQKRHGIRGDRGALHDEL